MIRIAALGDIHFSENSAGRLKKHLVNVERMADVLLMAGDLTNIGTPQEAEVLAGDIEGCAVPVVAVFGNHDYHSNQEGKVREILTQAGVTVLEKEATTLDLPGCRLGIYGMKGFGGGFFGACGSDFGEPEMKSFIQHTKTLASDLKEGLSKLDSDYKVALLHYSPTEETLLGERKEIYPFLGSYLLGEAVDSAGAQVIFHGHAHRGVEKGCTPGGIPVRNVAQPVIRHAFNVYTLAAEEFKYRESGSQLQGKSH